jgi:ADP-ribose pyrophosphatase YjhB (NUDIX family)
MRKRAGALVIRDRKLLLISEKNQNFFWTPGGGLETGEDYKAALVRELKEELDAELASATLFFEFVDNDADEEVRYFLVTLTSDPTPTDSATKLLHYTKRDYERNEIPISKRIYALVYPQLIAKGLV